MPFIPVHHRPKYNAFILGLFAAEVTVVQHLVCEAASCHNKPPPLIEITEPPPRPAGSAATTGVALDIPRHWDSPSGGHVRVLLYGIYLESITRVRELNVSVSYLASVGRN